MLTNASLQKFLAQFLRTLDKPHDCLPIYYRLCIFYLHAAWEIYCRQLSSQKWRQYALSGCVVSYYSDIMHSLVVW